MVVFDHILRNWIPAVDLVIRRGVHYLSFKDGIFQNVIPAAAPHTQEATVKALDILLAHELLNGNEKRTLTATRDLYIRLIREYGRDFSDDAMTAMHNMGEHVINTMMLSDAEHKRMSDCVEALEKIFDTDRSQRGIRIPSRGYQVIDGKGIITKTIFFDVDGHQLCVVGDYFKDIEMLEVRDYYDLEKQGPDGQTLRYLTARFMVAQGCQSHARNDLASEATQKQEVMIHVETKGEHAFITPGLFLNQIDQFSQNPPYDEHKLQEPTMFLQPWNVVKHDPDTNPLLPVNTQSIDILEEDCDFDEDDDDFMAVEEAKKKNNTRKPPVPKFEFSAGQAGKKPKVRPCKKIKNGVGAAVGSAFNDVKGFFN